MGSGVFPIVYIAQLSAVASGSFHKTGGTVKKLGVLLKTYSHKIFNNIAEVGAKIHRPTKKKSKFIFACVIPRKRIAPPSRTGRLRNP
jgi:hypothetical protein